LRFEPDGLLPHWRGAPDSLFHEGIEIGLFFVWVKKI
jgi:hypothetical protein